MPPKKSLGQHWLRDKASLEAIAAAAELSTADTVLEIGPGLGFLTKILAAQAQKLIAVEIDKALAQQLGRALAETSPKAAKIEVINQDFLDFDLSRLPAGYKIIGNIPYYITGKIVQKCLETPHRPKTMVFLVQKEVAERMAAAAGKMSILSVMAQFYADVSLGPVVTADKFDPPPKIDSRLVILQPKTLSPELEAIKKQLFQVVKAGFSARRKKLRSALAGGLGISKSEVENLLTAAAINSDLRAQDLTIADWLKISEKYVKIVL